MGINGLLDRIDHSKFTTVVRDASPLELSGDPSYSLAPQACRSGRLVRAAVLCLEDRKVASILPLLLHYSLG
jgi:hypothetical protein